jgi:hypothetical protein
VQLSYAIELGGIFQERSLGAERERPLKDGTGSVFLYHSSCSLCERLVISMSPSAEGVMAEEVQHFLVWPRCATRIVPPAVEGRAPGIAADFREAALVLPLSEKASAALSRRCLQAILVDHGGAKKRDLFDQIDEVSPSLPTRLSDDLHAVRVIGNIAAHTTKSEHTGEICDVEEGEAEWSLDVIESLFDHYFVQPARSQQKRAELNEKLKAAGRPALPK